MTATNHALTGAVIGLAVHQPLIAIPASLASHYVLDAIPHFDAIDASTKAYRYYLAAEATICAIIVLVLVSLQPSYWWLGAICAFVAASPDFMWVKSFIVQQKGRPEPKPKLWFVKLHARVQWFAKPIGIVVEAAWAILAISLLAILVKK